MNFKKICESVLDEADGRAVQLDSVALGRDSNGDLYLTEPTHRNIVTWTAAEYMRIQLFSEMWEFHHKRGTFLNVTANREIYKKKGIRRVDEHALYFVKTGTTARYPLITRPYEWWQYEQQYQTSSTSPVPTEIIEAPDDDWMLWPVPTAAGTITGDWWVNPSELVAADDEPCWDSQYHPILKWSTLFMYASEFAGENSAAKLLPRVQHQYAPMWDAFLRSYLDDPKAARTFF